MQRMSREQDKGAFVLPQHWSKGSQGANDHSAMDKYQAVRIATRRTGNAFIAPLIRGSEYAYVPSAQR
jgi:hypothetical protein